jgi:hypothetical protein
MASRILTFHCDVAIKDLLCRAIREYAHAAYPEGGSDCAQVARYTLLEAASAVDAAITADHAEAVISRRLRTTLRAAIDFHFDRQDAASGTGSVHQRAMFAGLLAGEPLSRAALDIAMAADGGSAGSQGLLDPFLQRRDDLLGLVLAGDIELGLLLVLAPPFLVAANRVFVRTVLLFRAVPVLVSENDRAPGAPGENFLVQFLDGFDAVLFVGHCQFIGG